MSPFKRALGWLLTLAMIGIGVMHFVLPGPLARIVPAWLPAPFLLVYISGVAEIAGGVALQIPSQRRAAAWGLILLYVAVFPANINQAMHHIPMGETQVAPWLLWARLPLQGVLIAFAYWFTRPDERR